MSEKQPKDVKQLKDLFPEIAAKTGITEKQVALVSRCLMKCIQTAIESDQVLRSKQLIIRKSIQSKKNQDTESGKLIGRIIVKSSTEKE